MTNLLQLAYTKASNMKDYIILIRIISIKAVVTDNQVVSVHFLFFMSNFSYEFFI